MSYIDADGRSYVDRDAMRNAKTKENGNAEKGFFPSGVVRKMTGQRERAVMRSSTSGTTRGARAAR